MMPRHALRLAMLAAVLAATPLLHATPISAEVQPTLDPHPTVFGAGEPVADAYSPLTVDSELTLAEPPLDLRGAALLDASSYQAPEQNEGAGFVWVFALSGCGALGLVAFRSNEPR